MMLNVVWHQGKVSQTVRYHITPTRMARIKDKDKCWSGCGETGTRVLLVGL